MLNTRELQDYARLFQQCRILVIGDLMIDEYVWGHIERISPEAPVPILSVVEHGRTLGGAGNVVRNLRALDVHVEVCGVVGRDETGEELTQLIEQLGVGTSGIVWDKDRKSTRKTRLMSLEHGQQVFRMDEETLQDVCDDVEDQIIGHIYEAAARADIILCSDYAKGTLTERVLRAVFEVSQRCGNITLVGPKGSDAGKYRGARILMLNQRELAQLTSTLMDGNGWLTDTARGLVERLKLEGIVVTRGGDGMSLFHKSAVTAHRVDIPPMAKSVYDVTGAGDTAISFFGAAIAAGAELEFGVRIANLAAGIKVGKRGANTVTIAEIERHLSEARRYSVGSVQLNDPSRGGSSPM
jgi:D-beta-D-heptose 7-phosphate kinase/D-beta-D-heptose 1-phosphate adenosyltransferase